MITTGDRLAGRKKFTFYFIYYALFEFTLTSMCWFLLYVIIHFLQDGTKVKNKLYYYCSENSCYLQKELSGLMNARASLSRNIPDTDEQNWFLFLCELHQGMRQQESPKWRSGCATCLGLFQVCHLKLRGVTDIFPYILWQFQNTIFWPSFQWTLNS